MIPPDLLQRMEFDGAEASILLRILVGAVAFAVLLRRHALEESAARMAAAVAVGVVAVGAVPVVDPNAHLSHPIGIAGVCMVAAAVPLWIELAAGWLMMGLATAALALHVVAGLAAMGSVPPGLGWVGIVLVAGAAGAAVYGRAPGVLSALVASGAAAWSLGFGEQPIAIGALFALGLLVSDLPWLTQRVRGKESTYQVGR